MFTAIFFFVGLLIGLVVGADQAKTVDAAAAGGPAVATLFQRDIIMMYVGWWTGGLSVVGLLIDLLWLRSRRRPDPYHMLSGGRRNAYISLSARYDSAGALDAVAEQYAAKRRALAAGLTPAEFDAQQAAVRKAQQAQAESRKQSRVGDLIENPIKWVD